MDKSILVIDDDKEILENIKEILMNGNYKVYSADSAAYALEIIKDLIPDLIISDIMMPGIDGLEFLSILKKDSLFSSIPFIFLTARSSYKDLRNGMSNGADDYLFKPFKSIDLLNAVKAKFDNNERMNSILNNLKETIALSVPHEFRTPLTPIIGLSNLLIEDIDNFSKEEIIKMNLSINTNAKRLLHRIEKFILFADIYTELNSISNYKFEKDFFSSQIQSFVINTITEYTNSFDFKKNLSLCNTNSVLKIHKYHFSLCIKELVENAFKFSLSQNKIAIIGRYEDGLYLLSFINDGKGLTRSQINSISLFNTNYDKNKTGSGIGLAVVKKIIDHYKGKLLIDSEPNVQTIITIGIPTVVYKNNS